MVMPIGITPKKIFFKIIIAVELAIKHFLELLLQHFIIRMQLLLHAVIKCQIGNPLIDIDSLA